MPTPPPQAAESPDIDELREAWPVLSQPERAEGFAMLPRPDSEDFFAGLEAHSQAELIVQLPAPERLSWMRLLPPDDAADVVQEAPQEQRAMLLSLLDGPTRKEVTALMAYAEDDAGGLMSPRFARLRPNITVDEAISYLRKQTRDRIETMNYVYVLDQAQVLLGVVSFRDLFVAPTGQQVGDIMDRQVITVHEEMDQEAVSRLFRQHGLMAMPVIDDQQRMQGVVTVDDIVEVVHEEATEDIQKYGGMEALEKPYLEIDMLRMIRKRAGWLSALFIGEMLTTQAMAHFEAELARVVFLGYFIPLIISSGGNTGSQASTLVIRAMALGEVRLTDLWRVVRRELVAGLALGLLLGTIGLLRITLWTYFFDPFGEHRQLVALTVAITLVGIVMFGTLAGSVLPFVMRRLNFDPASASGPFVATLVDVSGLVIYFSVARALLRVIG